ncbi:hypothetical protein ACN28I_45920 [Archangium gephyra]
MMAVSARAAAASDKPTATATPAIRRIHCGYMLEIPLMEEKMP